jgi:hypothetical protein
VPKKSCPVMLSETRAEETGCLSEILFFT